MGAKLPCESVGEGDERVALEGAVDHALHRVGTVGNIKPLSAGTPTHGDAGGPLRSDRSHPAGSQRVRGAAHEQGEQERHTHPVGGERELQPVTAPGAGVVYGGQMYPAPVGLGKQPTDCGRNHFGSHRTTCGNSTVNAMVRKKTM
jgi:hypothetical protein